MANCSMAYGTITLSSAWTDKMLKCLNTVKDEWGTWTYNILIDEGFADEVLTQGFFGCGRWTFRNNINSLGEWTLEECKTKPKLEAAYSTLIAEMERRDCYIDISYSDTESGNQVLYDGSARLRSKNSTLVVDSLQEINCEYNWSEYLDREFGGDALLEESVDNILPILRIEKKDRELYIKPVSDWIMNNTIPGGIVDVLEDEQIAELKALLFS